jgi:hypothetical protein
MKHLSGYINWGERSTVKHIVELFLNYESDVISDVTLLPTSTINIYEFSFKNKLKNEIENIYFKADRAMSVSTRVMYKFKSVAYADGIGNRENSFTNMSLMFDENSINNWIELAVTKVYNEEKKIKSAKSILSEFNELVSDYFVFLSDDFKTKIEKNVISTDVIISNKVQRVEGRVTTGHVPPNGFIPITNVIMSDTIINQYDGVLDAIRKIKSQHTDIHIVFQNYLSGSDRILEIKLSFYAIGNGKVIYNLDK